MKTFSQFLYEMPTLNTDWKQSDDESRHSALRAAKRLWPDTKKVGETEHHEIHQATHEGWKDQRAYFAIHKNTGRLDAVVSGPHDHETKTQDTDSLTTHPKSGINSHSFYHALIHKVGLTLRSSDNQNEGSSKTWQRLSKMKRVHVSLDSKRKVHRKNWNKNFGKFGDWGKTEKADQRFIAKAV